MGYAKFKSSPKDLTQRSDIGDGEIELRHLSAALYSELQRVSLHNHSGVKSRAISLKNLIGWFGRNGFYMYSSDATKRYKVTIDSGTDQFVLTEA